MTLLRGQPIVVRKRRTPEELSRQFEPSAQAIQNWVRQADRDSGRRHHGLTTEEREEVRRLRREVHPATKCLNGRLGYGDDLAR